MRFRNVLFAATAVVAAIGTVVYVWPSGDARLTPADAGPEVLDIRILSTARTCGATVFSCPVRLSGAALDWTRARALDAGRPLRPQQRYIQMRLRSVVCRDEATLARGDGGGFLDENGLLDARLANLQVEYEVLDGGLVRAFAERQKDLKLNEKEALGLEWPDLARCDESPCDGGVDDDTLCPRDTRAMALDAFPCVRAPHDGGGVGCRKLVPLADGGLAPRYQGPGYVFPLADSAPAGRAQCERTVCTIIGGDNPETDL